MGLFYIKSIVGETLFIILILAVMLTTGYILVPLGSVEVSFAAINKTNQEIDKATLAHE